MSPKRLSLSDTPHAKLLFIWSALDLVLLSAGILTVIASICFHRPKQLIINLIFDDVHFICGLALGAGYLAACTFSIPAILLGKGRLWALKALNWGLVVLVIATLLFASWIWFFSLRQLQELCDIWESQPANIQQAIQDQWSCCGYWNGTVEGKFETMIGFCADEVVAAGQPECMSIITSPNSPGTDHILNKIFTSLYGWIAILISFFLATVCIIKERQVEVRFARIDEKRGGGGFV